MKRAQERKREIELLKKAIRELQKENEALKSNQGVDWQLIRERKGQGK